MVVAGFSGPTSASPASRTGTVLVNTVPDDGAKPTVSSTNRFSALKAGRSRPIAMVKRKVHYQESSSNEESPSSLDGADYTDQVWSGSGSSNNNDWRSLSWAFGLGPSSSSSIVGRRRGRRGAAAARKASVAGASTPGGAAAEMDTMAELLEIVLWNDEREIDITAELTDEYDDSDDEDLAAIKRVMAREETLRPMRGGVLTRGATSGGGKNTVAAAGGGGGEKAETKKSSSGHLSVSSLRFDSLLRIGSTAESARKSSIVRLEQRTTTMERAFKGVLEDSYMSEAASRNAGGGGQTTSSLSSKTASTSTLVAGEGRGGDEENFWDDVEF